LKRGCKEDQEVTLIMPTGNGFLSERGRVSVLLFQVLHEQGYSGGVTATLACSSHLLLLQRVTFAMQKRHTCLAKHCLVTLCTEENRRN